MKLTEGNRAIQNRQARRILDPLISWRACSVLLTSTFRDRDAERDQLVTVILQQLRQLCEMRGVTWGAGN